MTLLRLAWRRVREHRAALAAVGLTLVASLLAIAGLAVLTDRVAASAVESSVMAAPADQRQVSASVSTSPPQLAALDDSIRAATVGPLAGQLTRASLGGSFGIVGESANSRAQIADLSDLESAGTLRAGRWPAGASGSGPIEVALPATALQALGWSVGSTHSLSPLSSSAGGPLRVSVVGSVDMDPGRISAWTALGLVVAGVREGDYPTYGPFLTSPGALLAQTSRQTSSAWLWEPDLSGLSAQTLAQSRADVDAVVGTWSGLPGLSAQSVRTSLPALLSQAAATSERVALVTLTPTLLILLLGGVALAVAAALMASLREQETRLLRARGGGQGQVATLAVLEGLGLAVPAAFLAVAVTAVGADALVRTAELPAVRGGATAVVQVVLGNGALLAGTALAVVLVVIAALRSGHLRSDRVLSTRAVSVTADVILLALGALGVLQLRRYRDSGGLTIDPLTVLAPALVIGGLVVLALRVIPLMARSAAVIAGRSRGLRLAWAAWQVARRVDAQRGAILLVMLAVAAGSLSLSYAATAERALVDQSAFAAGAPLRVEPGAEFTDASALADRYAALAGDAAAVMPVFRSEGSVAGSDRVTLLAGDFARDVLRPREDLVRDASWAQLRARLVSARPSAAYGLPLPQGARTLEVWADFSPVGGGFIGPPNAAQAILQGENGVRWTVPLDVPEFASGVFEGAGARLKASGALTNPADPSVGQVRLIAVTATLFHGESATNTAIVRSVKVDGEPLAGAQRLTSLPASAVLALGPTPPVVAQVPVVLSAQVAAAADIAVGGTLALPVQGRVVKAAVVGIIDEVPTASEPGLGVIADLPTLNAALDVVAGTSRGPLALSPQQWWLRPTELASARAGLTEVPRLAVSLVDEGNLLQATSSSPVQTGMVSVMRLLALAAAILATLGFAATTSALGRTRRREGAVLDALGFAPARLRGALVAERAAIVILAVAVGAVVGTLTAYLTLPLLLAADGRSQVPPVIVVTPWSTYAVALGGLVLVLIVVAALVLRGRREAPAEVLRGELPR